MNWNKIKLTRPKGKVVYLEETRFKRKRKSQHMLKKKESFNELIVYCSQIQ